MKFQSRRSLSGPVSAILSIACLAPLMGFMEMAPAIKRESSDARDAIAELECKPMDPASISALSDWSIPVALDRSSTEGKVVLLAYVSASDAQSIMMMSKLERMEREYEDQGIVVAAIHPEVGYEVVQEMVTEGKIEIPIARDTGGLFVSTMHTDDYPDLYLIDRAGNLRFADFDRRSIKDALDLLTSETVESARTNAELQAKGLEPELPEAVVEESAQEKRTEAYGNVQWPGKNTNALYAHKDSQGGRLPSPIDQYTIIKNERDYEGKVLIIDFWTAACGPCRSVLKDYLKLLEQYPDKLEIISISGDEDIDMLNRALDTGRRTFPQIHDPDKKLYDELQIMSVPHALVISTDGIIRWQGFPAERGFIPAVEAVIAADPKTAG